MSKNKKKKQNNKTKTKQIEKKQSVKLSGKSKEAKAVKASKENIKSKPAKPASKRAERKEAKNARRLGKFNDKQKRKLCKFNAKQARKLGRFTTKQGRKLKRFEARLAKKGFVYNNIWTALGLLIFSSTLGLISLYFGTGQYGMDLFNFYLDKPELLALNIGPFVLIAFLLWLVTTRPWIAFSLDGAICLLYSWASYWKLMARSDPIYAEDIYVFKAAASMSSKYISITPEIIYSAAYVLLATILIALLFRGRFKRILIILLALIIMLYGGAYAYENIYTRSRVYYQFDLWEELNPWFENSQFLSRGSIYPFIYSIPSALKAAPDGYDEEATENLLASYENDDIDEDQKVNVMCIMLEAFCDLSDYTDKIDSYDPYRFYHQITSESFTGTLVTNIFAGGTIDTERTALTGFYTLPNFRRASWSYARYFSKQGYSVIGAHAAYADMYNRINVNRNLGFENYLFYDNYFVNLCDDIPNDEVFMNELYDLFMDEINKDKYVFSYNVTYQGHGPYSETERYFSREYISRSAAGSDEAYYIINNYLGSVENTSYRLKLLIDKFRESEEPVVLVLFGDHKPWLGDQSWIYENLGIDLESESGNSNSGDGDAYYNRYATEYVIWANDAAKEISGNDFVGQGQDISSCYLMNILFEQLGWDGPSFMKFTNEVMEALPVITTNTMCVENGQLIYKTEMSAESKTLLNTFQYEEYYLSHCLE